MSTVIGWARLSVVFFRDLALSVSDVVKTVCRPSRPLRSAIVALPLDVKSDTGISLLANMITLTPGTTSLHVSEDRSTLYMHVMNLSDDTVEQTKAGFETLVMEVRQ
jgi:multicomponent Na+:H+ antiporter subunit E